MNPYILEHRNEADRLEQQAKRKAYDFLKDLEGIDFRSTQSVLDAGCGSGAVARELASLCPHGVVLGVDASPMRVAQARELGRKNSNLSFQESDLSRLELPDQSIDFIYCRYVLEHMSNERAQEVVNELSRVLRPGGTLQLVDVDGCLYSAFPQTQRVRKTFENLKSHPDMDLEIGRKLETFGLRAGLSSRRVQVSTWNFREADLEIERATLLDRFDQGRAFWTKLSGGDEEFEKFKQEFDTSLRSEGASLFYTTFSVRLTKPVRKTVLHGI